MIDPTVYGSAQMIMDQIKAYQTRVEQTHQPETAIPPTEVNKPQFNEAVRARGPPFRPVARGTSHTALIARSVRARRIQRVSAIPDRFVARTGCIARFKGCFPVFRARSDSTSYYAFVSDSSFFHISFPPSCRL